MGTKIAAWWANRPRLHLAQDWQDLHRKSSVRFSAVLATAAPTAFAIKETWNQMPDDLKHVLPDSVQQAISYSLIALLFIALRYTKVERPKESTDAANQS
jgi:hypothetical protein